MVKTPIARLLGVSGGIPPPPGISDFLRSFLCNLWVKLQKLNNILLNIVAVFEACRIKGVPDSASSRSEYKALHWKLALSY